MQKLHYCECNIPRLLLYRFRFTSPVAGLQASLNRCAEGRGSAEPRRCWSTYCSILLFIITSLLLRLVIDQKMKCALVTPIPSLPHPFSHLSRPSTRPTRRLLHPSPSSAANPLPVTQPGPPPTAPLPAASHYGERVDRHRRQAELIRKGQEIRSNQSKLANTLKKRFWKDVSVRTSPGMIPTLQTV